MRSAILFFVLSALVCRAYTPQPPAALKVDSLPEPLGDDSAKPLFSWELRDTRQGAAQSSYRIQVATSEALLVADRPDVWDSGRVRSEKSVGVPYAGPGLTPETRYFWRVQVSDQKEKSYPPSEVSCWETGLLNSPWTANWIAFEEPEHRQIRESGAIWISNADNGTGNQHDFRLVFDVPQGVKRADLFVTGQDTPAAWVNGEPVLAPQPLNAWHQMPWESYQERQITERIHPGRNVLAVGVTRYSDASPQSPMSACMYLEFADGSVSLFSTASPGWKAALSAAGDWFQPGYDDSQWQPAIPNTPRDSMSGQPIENPWPTGPVVRVRKIFTAASPIRSARLYATALGAYKMHLNGTAVGDQVLAPGWMDFREHVPYQVYDVTGLVKAGNNALAAEIAPGWYSTPLMWFRHGYNYGSTPPALRAQLRIQHADGSVEWISTGDSWKGAVSPTLKAEIYDGETYDARLEQAAWDTVDAPAQPWRPVQIVSPKEPEIVAQFFQPIKEERTLRAKAMSNPAPGVYIFDFGQNMAGVPRISVSGPRGTDVRLRFGEALNEDGSLYTENLRTAKATDHFILAGTGAETWQPQFTFHGFRYAELSGLPAQPPPDSLKAVVLHTAAPFTSRLRTGSAMVNQLWSNILWGQRSNFVGLPTDCPQRDERLGWTADAQVFWRTASFNMDLTAFSQKYAGDLRGTQVGTAMYGIFAPGVVAPSPGFAAGWSDAGIVIPWTSWVQTGDTRVVEQNWDAMERYLAAILSANPDHLWRNQYGIPFGDWLTPTQTTPEDLLATALWAYDASLMEQMARASGRADKAQKYSALFSAIRTAFDQAYVHSDGTITASNTHPSIPPPSITKAAPVSPDVVVETQTAYVLALQVRLLPDELRKPAADRLVEMIKENGWRLGTGFLGTPYLLEVLADTGHADIAYRLLLNTEYPSWGYLVQHGATTMWERWNGDRMRSDPSMNSYNHYAYGAVAEWIYRYAAGVDTQAADPGFHTVLLHPHFDPRLGSCDFTYDSPYGQIASRWTAKGANAEWTVTIPANATGWLPLSAMTDRWKVPPHLEKRSGGYRLRAGTYRFRIASE